MFAKANTTQHVWYTQLNVEQAKKNKNNLQRPIDINTFHFFRELLQFAKDNDAIAQEIAMR